MRVEGPNWSRPARPACRQMSVWGGYVSSTNLQRIRSGRSSQQSRRNSAQPLATEPADVGCWREHETAATSHPAATSGLCPRESHRLNRNRPRRRRQPASPRCTLGRTGLRLPTLPRQWWGGECGWSDVHAYGEVWARSPAERLAKELKDKTYRPSTVRRVWIPPKGERLRQRTVREFVQNDHKPCRIWRPWSGVRRPSLWRKSLTFGAFRCGDRRL